MQRLRVVSNDLQPAALGRPFGTERAYKHVAPWLHRAGHLLNVRYPFLNRGKKMEHSAVVPYIVETGPQFGLRNIAGDPLDKLRGLAQSPSGYIDRCLRNIEHGDVSVSTGQ